MMMMNNNYFQMMKKHKILKKLENQKNKEKFKLSINFGETIIKILNQDQQKMMLIVKNLLY